MAVSYENQGGTGDGEVREMLVPGSKKPLIVCFKKKPVVVRYGGPNGKGG